MGYRFYVYILFCVALPAFCTPNFQSLAATDQAQVAPPSPRAEAPSATASADDLEKRADLFRVKKSYLNALDYYQAALSKDPHNARLFNKCGIVELEIQRYRDAGKDFTRATRADRKSADSYNNLGVVSYLEKKYPKAIKLYKKAIQLDGNSASFYSNLATAYFSKQEFEAATVAYTKAVELDPDIFEHTSRNGVAGLISSPAGPRTLRLRACPPLRENGKHYPVPGVSAPFDGGRIQRRAERLQRSRVRDA